MKSEVYQTQPGNVENYNNINSKLNVLNISHIDLNVKQYEKGVCGMSITSALVSTRR